MQNYVNQVNVFTGTTFDYNTIFGAQNPFVYRTFGPYVSQTTNTQFGPYAHHKPAFGYGEIVDVSQPDWYTTDGGVTYYFYKAYLRVTITDTNDPENNWELESRLNPDGTLGSWVTIYEIP